MAKETPCLLAAALACLVLCPMFSMAYPVFGTKRYGRSSPSSQYAPSAAAAAPAAPYPVHIAYQQPSRTQRFHPVTTYYDMYPYAGGYADPDYYYPQQQEALTYPIYYAPARTSKYEVYQAVLPYYYEDRRLPSYAHGRNVPDVGGYGYYGGYGEDDAILDPVDNLQEEILQEQEREEREEASPIGQETWFENDRDSDRDSTDRGIVVADDMEENMDDVNAAFLQNLILSQMYNNALDDPRNGVATGDRYYPDDPWGLRAMDAQEDEDVRELKQLASLPERQKSHLEKEYAVKEKEAPFKDQKQAAAERMHLFRKGGNSKKKMVATGPNDSQKWRKWDSKRTASSSSNAPLAYGKAKIVLDNRKQPAVQHPQEGQTTQRPSNAKTETSLTPGRDARGGQKEVMLMRPATPIRHPFSEPVMEMLAERNNNNKERSTKRVPSVYDTIKHMLEMEKSLEKEKGTGGQHHHSHNQEDVRLPMKKRFVMNEETLVKQLSGLKNAEQVA